mmetsp:Transcript_19279/g.57737  ORF Transcript_19279/g.57737 Transcript_19279/m.57737 type:complete len:362 (+) Transcript_19279:3026-4111(+)
MYKRPSSSQPKNSVGALSRCSLKSAASSSRVDGGTHLPLMTPTNSGANSNDSPSAASSPLMVMVESCFWTPRMSKSKLLTLRSSDMLDAWIRTTTWRYCSFMVYSMMRSLESAMSMKRGLLLSTSSVFQSMFLTSGAKCSSPSFLRKNLSCSTFASTWFRRSITRSHSLTHGSRSLNLSWSPTSRSWMSSTASRKSLRRRQSRDSSWTAWMARAESPKETKSSSTMRKSANFRDASAWFVLNASHGNEVLLKSAITTSMFSDSSTSNCVISFGCSFGSRFSEAASASFSISTTPRLADAGKNSRKHARNWPMFSLTDKEQHLLMTRQTSVSPARYVVVVMLGCLVCNSCIFSKIVTRCSIW